MKPPPPPPPPLPQSPPPPPLPLSSASRAEAFKSTSLQNEAEKKKPFIKSPLAYFMAVIAGAIVAPTGLILSPVVLLLSNLKGEYTNKKGQKITPLASWIGAGIVLTPLCWITNQTLLSNHSQQDSNQTQLVEKQRTKTNENLNENIIGAPLFRGRSGCERTLKKMLRDPNSLEGEEYVVTAANPQSWTAQIIFRSKNGFGGMNRSVANCTFDGQVYLVNILQDQ